MVCDIGNLCWVNLVIQTGDGNEPTSSHCDAIGSLRGAYTDICPALVNIASRHLSVSY
jgi:hypothetical protein